MIDQRRHLDSQGRGSAENICKGHAQHPRGGVVAGGVRAGGPGALQGLRGAWRSEKSDGFRYRLVTMAGFPGHAVTPIFPALGKL